jgi:hypothetical protein
VRLGETGGTMVGGGGWEEKCNIYVCVCEFVYELKMMSVQLFRVRWCDSAVVYSEIMRSAVQNLKRARRDGWFTSPRPGDDRAIGMV